MYVSRPPYIIYRDYPNYGYLTDNRSFGYDTAAKSCLKTGDRIISKTGSIFYSVLSLYPKSLYDITLELQKIFNKTSFQEIYNDATVFFDELAADGFVDYGESPHIANRENYFSYKRTCPIILQDSKSETQLLNGIFESSNRLTRVHLNISDICNEHCIHCYFPCSRMKNIMPIDMFFSILKQCKEMNVLNITISGGEPMTNQYLGLYLRECRKHNFSVNLLSNLTLLTDKILEELIQSPLTSVQTSLYSMDEDVHDSITQSNGSFNKTKAAILRLHKYNIPMQINCPILKPNKDNYKDVIAWARSLNIEASSDYMIFGSYNCSRENLSCRLNIEEVEEVLQEDYQGTISDEPLPQKISLNDSICPICSNSICISNTGDLYPCEGLQNIHIGNIRDTPLSDLWGNAPIINSLRKLSYNDFPQCFKCKDRDYCSICLIRNANENKDGDYMQPSPYFCKIAEIKKKNINSQLVIIHQAGRKSN